MLELNETNYRVILDIARARGGEAARDRLKELQATGPKYRLIEHDIVVGELLDDNGEAWIRVNGRCPGHKLLSRVKLPNWVNYEKSTTREGGWTLTFASIYDGPEKSCFEAAYSAVVDLLRDYGFDAVVESKTKELIER